MNTLNSSPKPIPLNIAKGKETRSRHNNMFCRVFELKLQSNHLSAKTKQKLDTLFIQSKRFYNHCIQHLDSIASLDCKIDTVKVKVNSELENRTIDDLPFQVKQSIKQQVICSLKAIKTVNQKNASKKNKPNEGQLKFKSECNSISLVKLDPHGTHAINRSNNTVRINGVKPWLRVNGLHQIPLDCDICNAVLLKKCDSYYLHVTTYSDKPTQYKTTIIQSKVPIGIDLGCSSQITTSDGLQLQWNIPVDKGIKQLDRKINKKRMKHLPKLERVKGQPDPNKRPKSKNRTKDLMRRKKRYERLTNRRKDTRNKVVSFLKRSYAVIVLQDDSIKGWQSGSHGKKVSNTGIGGIKSALKNRAATSIMVDQFYASSQICSCCGYKQKMERGVTIYECPQCSINMNRDINGATNILTEGLQLGSKTVVQRNADNHYHVKKEQDMVIESNRIKSLESTMQWKELMQDLVLKNKNEKVMKHKVTCGAHESYIISPFVTSSRPHIDETIGMEKPFERSSSKLSQESCCDIETCHDLIKMNSMTKEAPRF